LAGIKTLREVTYEDVREGELLDALSAFTARLHLASASAGRTITTATTGRTSRSMSEYDDIVGNPLSQSFSFSVTNRAIPVAGGVTIGTGLGGHTARRNTFSDSGLVPRHGQDKTCVDGAVRPRSVAGAAYVDYDELRRLFLKRIRPPLTLPAILPPRYSGWTRLRYRRTKPWRMPRATASVLLAAPSLPRMDATWNLTVCSEIVSRVAISLFPSPLASI